MACTIVTTERRLTAVVKIQAPMNKLPESQRSARAAINAALPSLDTGQLGPTCTLWRPPTGGALYMEPGTVVSQAFASTGEVVLSALPAGRAAHLSMKGSFEGLPQAWQTLFDWCKAEGLPTAGTNWEIYGAAEDTELYALLA
jgi:hypothetical protein